MDNFFKLSNVQSYLPLGLLWTHDSNFLFAYELMASSKVLYTLVDYFGHLEEFLKKLKLIHRQERSVTQ